MKKQFLFLFIIAISFISCETSTSNLSDTFSTPLDIINPLPDSEDIPHCCFEFSWYPSGNSDYIIHIGNDTNFESAFIKDTVGDPNFTLLETLIPNTRYYWQIESINTGQTKTSSFKTVDYGKVYEGTFPASFRYQEKNGMTEIDSTYIGTISLSPSLANEYIKYGTEDYRYTSGTDSTVTFYYELSAPYYDTKTINLNTDSLYGSYTINGEGFTRYSVEADLSN